MKPRILIVVALGSGLTFASCIAPRETSFYSNFSIRHLVRADRAGVGVLCDSNGLGGGIDSRSGGISLGWTRFKSHKGDELKCRLKSNEDFDEAKVFTTLKLNVERALHDNNAQITDTVSSSVSNFYFDYTLQNVRGRVQVSGDRDGRDNTLRADLDESGD